MAETDELVDRESLDEVRLTPINDLRSVEIAIRELESKINQLVRYVRDTLHETHYTREEVDSLFESLEEDLGI